MGQKIHPTGFRLSVSRDWASRWYANSRNYPVMLNEDLRVREYLGRRLKGASVGRIVIERPARNARITIYSARPGVVIGKKGEDIEQLKSDLQKLMGVPVHVNIEEIRKPNYVPPRHEACDAKRYAAWGARHQDNERWALKRD